MVLRELRKRFGLTVADMSRGLKKSRQSVEILEKRGLLELSVRTLHCYAKALGMKLNILMVDKEGDVYFHETD